MRLGEDHPGDPIFLEHRHPIRCHRTLVWGVATGTLVLAIRSIWPVVVAHWLLNVFIEALIVYS